MPSTLRFTDETEIVLEGLDEVQDVHLEDLSFVLDVESEDGEVTKCTLDMPQLVRTMTIYSSMEELRHGWRRG